MFAPWAGNCLYLHSSYHILARARKLKFRLGQGITGRLALDGRARRIADDPFSTEAGALTITISLGLAALNESTLDFDVLLKRADDALLADLVRQAARELLLLEASDWPFLISTWTARDYAERRAALHHQAFTRLAELARQRAEGEELSPEDISFLRECETRDALFPELDPNWWARVERPAQP